MTGTRVGNWVLQTEIGVGPWGAVYRAAAVDAREDAPQAAAVKLFTLAAQADPPAVARFTAELLGLRRLTHPNLARFYEAGVHAGVPFTATELVCGSDAKCLLLKAGAGLSWNEQVLSFAVQATRALKHAHHRSVLHRGLKPTNLLVNADGVLKLTDCGVAKAFAVSPLALPGDPWGTAGFLAPEHFTGKPLTRRSDLYALGGVLYALVAGRPPFAAQTPAELMHKHCYMLPDRPMNFVPKLPPELDELICNLLSKDPTRRPASAVAVLEELDRIRGRVERKGISVVFPVDPGDPTASHVPLPSENESESAKIIDRTQVLKIAGVAVLLLAALTGIGYALFRPGPDVNAALDAARPLLASDNPDDWEKAWTQHLEPLHTADPSTQLDEVRDAKARADDRRELNRVLVQGGQAKASSEAERLYGRGLALARAGDFAGAKQTWQGLASIFAADAAAERWVRAAKMAAAAMDRQNTAGPGAAGPAAVEVASAAANRARNLRALGQAAAADSILKAAADLYRDTPDALAALRP
jgi:eukaryotic-like serine/threonine-protein kinase